MHKPSVHWQRIVDVLPEPNQECLVWTGHYMYVSGAHFHDQEMVAREEADIGKEWGEFMRASKGCFEEFGQKHYFDDKEVQWSPVPLAPGEQNPPQPDPMDQFDSKDIYLKKDDVIVGLHAIGHRMPYEYDLHHADGSVTREKTDFMQLEVWGNEYDENHQMLGRGSFRVHDEIELAAKEFEADGFVRYKGPKKK